MSAPRNTTTDMGGNPLVEGMALLAASSGQVLELHTGLTEPELVAAHAAAGGYLDRAIENPRIYGDRKPRAIEFYRAAAAAMTERGLTARTKSRDRRR